MKHARAFYGLAVVVLALSAMGASCPEPKPGEPSKPPVVKVPEKCKGIEDPLALLTCINSVVAPFLPSPTEAPPRVTASPTSPPDATPTTAPTSSPVPPSPSPTSATCAAPPPIWKINGAQGCVSWLPKTFQGKTACGLDATIWQACDVNCAPTMGAPRVPTTPDGKNYAPSCDRGHMGLPKDAPSFAPLSPNPSCMSKCCGGVVWNDFEDARGIDFKSVTGPCVESVEDVGNNWERLVVFKAGCKDHTVTTVVCPPAGATETHCGNRYPVIGNGCGGGTFTAK